MVFLFGFIRYHGRALEGEAAQMERLRQDLLSGPSRTVITRQLSFLLTQIAPPNRLLNLFNYKRHRRTPTKDEMRLFALQPCRVRPSKAILVKFQQRDTANPFVT
jgi:hypothetical protein